MRTKLLSGLFITILIIEVLLGFKIQQIDNDMSNYFACENGGYVTRNYIIYPKGFHDSNDNYEYEIAYMKRFCRNIYLGG